MVWAQDALRVVRSAHEPPSDVHLDGQAYKRNPVVATVLMCALALSFSL